MLSAGVFLPAITIEIDSFSRHFHW